MNRLKSIQESDYYLMERKPGACVKEVRIIADPENLLKQIHLS